MPDNTNGTASTTVDTATDTISITEKVVSGRKGIERLMTCETGIADASRNVVRASVSGARSDENLSGLRKTKTAPAAMPSMASDTAKNDR